MIQVLSPGMYTTIQDRGRRRFRKFGVPVSGAMDMYSAGLANLLLNNPEDFPVIEITMQGPGLQFNCTTEIVLTGADISPEINHKKVSRNKVIQIAEGDRLSFGKLILGCRCYLAVRGGFELPKLLDSYSYYPGIADHALLKTGMELKINAIQNSIHRLSSVKIDGDHFLKDEISVEKGPEFEMLSLVQRNSLFQQDFTISSKNDRMGYQLSGDPIQLENSSRMLTGVTIPGTVQLTPAGYPIVLMRDCQTTGGYPRILQLTENGINRLAQKKTNEKICFQLDQVSE